jgi:hypothetical protein
MKAVSAKKDSIMTLFGTMKLFDEVKGSMGDTRT